MRIGIDTGGTFTDFAYVQGGMRIAFKLPTVPDAPEAAALEGARRILDAAGPIDDALDVRYGTTIATNALLTRSGARVALVTTKGFEDVIEIGRQDRPKLYAMKPEIPPPLIDRNMRVGLAERIDCEGVPISSPTSIEIERTVKKIKRLKPEAVAICLLHSYKNPSHELALAGALRKEFGGDLPLMLSSSLDPYPREYERTSTTVIHAYLSKSVGRYLRLLPKGFSSIVRAARRDDTAKRSVNEVSVELLTSGGGTAAVERAVKRPADLVLSGPAGGVIGAAAVARRAAVTDFVGFDMGGTSTDVCLGSGGVVREDAGRDIAGFPLRTARLAVHTIGAGGGSIARRGVGGSLVTGPESAGADPGPAAYGKGEFVTVTDADLILNLMPRDVKLGGVRELDSKRSAEYTGKLARTLKLSVKEAAEGIVRIVNQKMAQAVREVSQKVGFDPRLLTLVPFGGIGAVHACGVADELGITQILVPPHAGCLSALGAYLADARMDESVTVLEDDRKFLKIADKIYAAIEKKLQRELGNECVFRREALARYPGQGYELAVTMSTDLRAVFAAEHERMYGFSKPDSPVEIVAAKVTAIAPSAMDDAVWSVEEKREVIETGKRLKPGMKLKPGWHIVDHTSTTYIGGGWGGAVDRHGNLRLKKDAGR